MKKLSVNVLLLDGDAYGVLRVYAATQSIIAYKLPRASLESYKEREDLAKSGVYMLLGNGMVYVGQAGARQNGASGIVARLIEHDKSEDKSFWTEALFFVSKEDTLGQTELSYLENAFYERSVKAERYLVINASKPTPGNVTEEKEAELEAYLWYAEQVLVMLGYKVFEQLSAEQKEERKNAIELLELPVSTNNVLRRAGFYSVEDLLRKVQSYRELARVRHVGKKRAQEILVAMEAKGFYVEHLKKV